MCVSNTDQSTVYTQHTQVCAEPSPIVTSLVGVGEEKEEGFWRGKSDRKTSEKHHCSQRAIRNWIQHLVMFMLAQVYGV